jgi:hypothetical protein
MTNCGVEMRHYCGHSGCDANIPQGKDSEVFCYQPHPDTVYDENVDKDVPVAHCRRLPGHEGAHSAYIFSIVTTTEWVSA